MIAARLTASVALVAGAVAAVAASATPARADGVADTRTDRASDFEVTMYYGRYGFPDQPVPDAMTTESVGQTQWGVALRGILFDPRRRTVQGHVPAVWMTFEVGKIGDDTATDPMPDDDGGDGGVYYRQQIAAPWSVWSHGDLELAAGLGGEFGIQVGRTAIGADRDEHLLIAGAFAHVHVRGKLAGFPFNAQYQWALAGIDYREHRLDARIVRGHLTAGVDLIVGRRDGDPSTYRMLAISAGFHFGS
ncbi:MAG: hypothetical protein H6709_13195 [Kofleriaceae bacterium]|nr:hypothetical protein [Myxococcales bacterium]MCB9573033.1 hypothetical protein [Kofleriaceae bacterium]